MKRMEPNKRFDSHIFLNYERDKMKIQQKKETVNRRTINLRWKEGEKEKGRKKKYWNLGGGGKEVKRGLRGLIGTRRLVLNQLGLHVQMRKTCAILDVDETLVHTFSTPFRKTYETPTSKDRLYRLNISGTRLWGVKRPYLKLFIDFCFNTFDEVGIISAGTREYIEALLPLIRDEGENLKPFLFVWTRENCTEIDGIYYKPMSSVFSAFKFLNPANTVLFDDRDDVVPDRNWNNVVVPSFSPQPRSLDLYDNNLLLIIRHFRIAKKPYTMSIKKVYTSGSSIFVIEPKDEPEEE